MESTTLELPVDLARVLNVPKEEAARCAVLELAVSLYAQNRISLGKAAQIAGMGVLDLNDVLASRRVPMHYGMRELEQDIEHAGHRQ